MHGFAENRPVTLLGCSALRTESYWFGDSVAKQTIRADQALIGIHLSDRSSDVFAGLELEVENLSEWSHESDVEILLTFGEDGTQRFSVNVEPAESRSGEVEAGLSAMLSRYYHVPDYDHLRGGLSVETRAISYLEFQSVEPRALAGWTSVGKLLQDLVTLATASPCAVLRETLIPSQAAQEDVALSAQPQVLWYARRAIQGQPANPAVRYDQYLFSLADIAFGDVLPRWSEIFRDYSAPCDMVLSLFYRSDDYLQSQVLTAVPAAEALHKSMFGGRATLKDRLLRLATTPYPALIGQLVPNPEAWAEATKSARHGLAHGDSSSDTILLHNAVVRVTVAVILLNLLNKLQIPEDRVKTALYDNSSLSYAARLAKEYWPAITS